MPPGRRSSGAGDQDASSSTWTASPAPPVPRRRPAPAPSSASTAGAGASQRRRTSTATSRSSRALPPPGPPPWCGGGTPIRSASCAHRDLGRQAEQAGDLPLSVAAKFVEPTRFFGELSSGLSAEEKRRSVPWVPFHRWLDRVTGIDVVGSMPTELAGSRSVWRPPPGRANRVFCETDQAGASAVATAASVGSGRLGRPLRRGLRFLQRRLGALQPLRGCLHRGQRLGGLELRLGL
jgi:hypothetical protein